MLMERASHVAGGRQWEDLSFQPALELLTASCQTTAALTPKGRRVHDSIIVRHLVNRLLVEAEMETRPELATRLAGPAIVVTGLPRTGTTLLHNMLALDPQSRTLRFWEALRPVPPCPGDGTSEVELIRQAATWLERLYELVPAFRSIHAATAEGPEECDALLQNDFASQHFDDMFNAEDYSAWLAGASLNQEYRSYARQLSVLRRPADGTDPWVLKSPSHLGHLDALLDACPDATIVLCHRHPFEAVPSYASLVLCLRQAYSDHVSPVEVGHQAMRRCETAMSRALDMRRRMPDRFVDVVYGDLVRRPLATVAALYEQLGRRLPSDVANSITAWLVGHPQHRHGMHRYTGETFGLTAESMTRAFAPYLDAQAGIA